MNPSIIRGVGMGIFLTAVLFHLINTLATSEAALQSTPKGYELIESSKLSTLQDELSTSKEQLAKIQLDLEEASREPENIESNEETPAITHTVLIIRANMTSTEISSSLEQTGIIKNQKDLDNYLIDNNLTTRIQIGTYNLNSSMTLAEIANLITK